ncbi:MAG TPA: PPC domain-containing protein [Longimicrobiales bacterium]|nr:PPC domain-containing protein [Longimicrobiales bacterium]
MAPTKEYRFDARAGDRLVIRLDSDDFDPFLTLGRSPGGTFESVASDDDSGSGVNALLEYDVTTSGTYVIRANSWSGGSTGAFTLSLGRR